MLSSFCLGLPIGYRRIADRAYGDDSERASSRVAEYLLPRMRYAPKRYVPLGRQVSGGSASAASAGCAARQGSGDSDSDAPSSVGSDTEGGDENENENEDEDGNHGGHVGDEVVSRTPERYAVRLPLSDTVLGPELSLTVSPESIDAPSSPASPTAPLLPLRPCKSSLKPARSFTAPPCPPRSLWTLRRTYDYSYDHSERPRVSFAPRATYLTITEHHAPSWVRCCARTSRPIREGVCTLGMRHRREDRKQEGGQGELELVRVASGSGGMGVYDEDAGALRRARTWIERVGRHTA